MIDKLAMPEGDEWKNPAFVRAWKRERAKAIAGRWEGRAALEEKIKRSAELSERIFANLENPADAVMRDDESLLERARRLEGATRLEIPYGAVVREVDGKKKLRRGNGAYSVPDLITRVATAADMQRNGWDPEKARGEIAPILRDCEFLDQGWILNKVARKATPDKICKSKRMFEVGLTKKAQRELACGILGGRVHCENWHRFVVDYECGNRYCPTCGPIRARQLFARHRDPMYRMAAQMLVCSEPGCVECESARAVLAAGGSPTELPHWPPPKKGKRKRPRVVVACLDFTTANIGKMPTPAEVRDFNLCIKEFFIRCMKRFGFTRADFGYAWCDEFGAKNSNLHCHGIYVGPWLPNSKKDKKLLWEIWREVTGGKAYRVYIEYARNLGHALYHALKYPDKYCNLSTAERRADLEAVFHRVRRFHALARFYNIKKLKKEETPVRKCPKCGARLSEIEGWKPLDEFGRIPRLSVMERLKKLLSTDGEKLPCEIVDV